MRQGAAQSGYGGAPAYGNPPAYGGAPAYGNPPAYGGAPAYGNAPAYGGGPGYSGSVAPGAYAPQQMPPAGQGYQQAPVAPGSMSAESLIDNRAVPGWINSNVARPATNNSGGMPASALIDESALPQWLRNNPDVSTVAPGMGATPGWGGVPSQAINPAVQPGEEALPSWLSQVVNGGPIPPPDPQFAAPAPAPMAAQQPGGIDPSALPAWLQPQAAQPEPMPQMGSRQPAANSEWLTDRVIAQVNGMGTNGADLPEWLRQDQPGMPPAPQDQWHQPEHPLPTGELPQWLNAGNGNGASSRHQAAAPQRGGWGGGRQQQGYQGGYNDQGEDYGEWDEEPEEPQTRGFLGRFRRR